MRHRQVTKSCPGKKTMPSLRHCQVTKSPTLPFLPGKKLCPVSSLAGKEVMPCSAFAEQESWCARAHGFSRPRDSRLSAMSSFTFLWHRASVSRALRTRDFRKEVTGQSPRHCASRMKQTVRTGACDFGETPLRSFKNITDTHTQQNTGLLSTAKGPPYPGNTRPHVHNAHLN